MERFFYLMLEKQQVQKQTGSHMYGCPLGNLTLEMSTQDEVIRAQVEATYSCF
jgi:TetR/AcrR family transcriptional regulator, transcriptional repressor for nem operon